MTGYIYSLVLLLTFQTNIAMAQLSDAQKAEIAFKNILVNSGFESGKSKWTPNDTADFATVTSGSNLLTGKVSATWDADASADTLLSTAVTIPKGLYGKNGLAYCTFQTPSGTATHEIQVYDGSNVLVETAITSRTLPIKSGANFIFPSSGSLSVRIYANADEPLVAIDDCYLGDASNITSVSQAIIAGESYFAGTASCGSWARTSATIGAFSADTDCPGPTIVRSNLGSWQTTDADLPRQTINSLPAGDYKATFIFEGLMSAITTPAFAINDGTTTCEAVAGSSDADNGSNTVVSCTFSYASSGNRVFELYSGSAANTVTITNSRTSPRQSVKFILERFPPSSEQAMNTETVAWKLDLNISGANIDLGTSNQASYITPNNGSLTMTVNTSKGSAPAGISCSSTNDNTVGSTTCSAGSEEPGFVANFPRAGLVRVCYSFSQAIANAASGSLSAAFQVARTANGSQTIAEEGGARVVSGNNTANATLVAPHDRLCGAFQIPTAAKHTIRLMYEQSVTATVTSNVIQADANASVGQRDVYITAEYIDQSVPAPLIIDQPKVAGASYFAGTAACGGWTRTNTAIGAFATDADCPGPTVEFSNLGTWATTDVNLPEQTITGLPAGRYRAKFIFPALGGGNNFGAFAINDGTTTCRGQQGTMLTTNSIQTTVECWFTYTDAQASVSYELYAGSSVSSLTVDISGTTPAAAGVSFSLEYWPR